MAKNRKEELYGPSITVDKVIEILDEDHENPIMLWGPAGVGKTEVCRQVADLRKAENPDYGFIILPLTICDPVDLRGVPFQDNEDARWSRPVFLPREGEGLLLLDELPSAPPAVQVSAHQLVQLKQIGPHKVAEGWQIIATGNRSCDEAMVFSMAAPLCNRFCHFEVKPDADTWIKWAMKQLLDPRHCGFINQHPEKLYDADAIKASRAFPTPRTHEKVARLFKRTTPNLAKNPLDNKVVRRIAEGWVGRGCVGVEQAYLKLYKDLRDPREYLAGKSKEVPEDRSALIAAIYSVIYLIRVWKETGKKPSSLKVRRSQAVDNILKWMLEFKRHKACGAALLSHLIDIVGEEVLSKPVFTSEVLKEYRDVIS